MFSAPKLAKNKPLVPPSHKDTRFMNTRRKYVSDLTTRGTGLCNQSFDTAQTLLQNGTDGNTLGKKDPTRHFFLMPLPKENKKQEIAQEKPQSEPEILQHNNMINPMMKTGRNAVVLMGKVKFCIEMHKLYPKINAMWDVYGKIFKIVKGKNRFEHTILLRNPSGDGPVLHCIFYDFNDFLQQFQTANCVRVVGRFVAEHRLQSFKIEKLNSKSCHEEFARIQNVISFVLLQNQE